MPPNAIYIGRPTIFGNPFRILDRDQDKRSAFGMPDVVALYRSWLNGEIIPTGTVLQQGQWSIQRIRALEALRAGKLRGKDLCCWCRIDVACHGDVLLELANNE